MSVRTHPARNSAIFFHTPDSLVSVSDMSPLAYLGFNYLAIRIMRPRRAEESDCAQQPQNANQDECHLNEALEGVGDRQHHYQPIDQTKHDGPDNQIDQ